MSITTASFKEQLLFGGQHPCNERAEQEIQETVSQYNISMWHVW